MDDEELRSSLADVMSAAARRGTPDVAVLRQRIRRRTLRRWLSGLVVVAVIAGIGLGVNASLTGGTHGVPGSHPVAGGGPQALKPGTWSPAAALPAADAGPSVAPYFISMDNPPSGPAYVEDAANGTQLAPISPPCDCTYIGVAAAGDDHTFVLAASGGHDIRFFEMRLSATGKPGAPQLLLTVPAASTPEYLSFALSPDASMLAYATRTGITVVSLPTRKATSWPSAGGTASEFSWAADDHTLAFGWWPQSTSAAALKERGVRVLDTRHGGTVLQASRLVVGVGALTDDGNVFPVITADGSKILVSYDFMERYMGGGLVGLSLVGEFSVRTGKPLLTSVAAVAPLYADLFEGETCQAVWTDPSGRQVVSSCSNGAGDVLYNGHKVADTEAFQVTIDPTSEPSPDGSFGQEEGQEQMGPLVAW
jgi:hypothetical protein